MPVLDNAKHELFAQAVAKGLGQAEAYALAGYLPSEPHASRLARNGKVQARVAEILGRGAAKAEVTAERVIRELAKIGFSDIRKAVNWQANVTGMVAEDDGTERLAVTNQVQIIDSDKIDDETAAAIAEISQTDRGGLKVKFHDKQAALVQLGRHLGIFTDKTVMDLNVTSESAALSALAELVAGASGEGEDRARPHPLPN